MADMNVFRRWLVLGTGILLIAGMPLRSQEPVANWVGTLTETGGKPVAQAQVELRDLGGGPVRLATVDEHGTFVFKDLPAREYSIIVHVGTRTVLANQSLTVQPRQALRLHLELGSGEVRILTPAAAGEAEKESTGGEVLSSRQVSEIPLNKRDFSQLLLLAAGTMTDANGTANFTQQFAVNGQRGTTGVFAMDGLDSTDPEAGGATFSNFNVDAIQEIKSSSGVMPAEIGHGAAGFTNIITKSGTDNLHGSVFEFVRNAAFDARNFFDRRTFPDQGRIPPFARNEFGFTLGGPIVLPGVYDGRGRTFVFGEYQGFRQVLSTTQVLSVPTAAERTGLDTTAFPGDTLIVPVDPQIAPILAHYPLPNDAQGAYGARTFATPSKVSTNYDQFSVRVDHRVSDKANFFSRFTFADVTGPLTNPNQTAIDPSYAIRFLDHQRSAAARYTRTPSPHFSWSIALGYIRATPLFPAVNTTQPGLLFGDGLYEPVNSAVGQQLGAYGNLWQGKLDFTLLHGAHNFKWGWEIRENRDADVWGQQPNGQYTFGGNPAYAPVAIPSASGQHDIAAGAQLPDALTGFLAATPAAYTISEVTPISPVGDRFNEDALRRNAYNAYFQDSWKVTPRLQVDYGLRYEFDPYFDEASGRSSGVVFHGPPGKPARSWDPGVYQDLVIRLAPPFKNDWNGFGPRLAVSLRQSQHTVWHAGAAVTTRLINLFQEDFTTGSTPYSVQPFLAAQPGVPVPFSNTVPHYDLPLPYTPAGQPIYPHKSTEDPRPNTVMDVQRYEDQIAAITPGHQIQPLQLAGMMPNYADGYIQSYTAGVEQNWGGVTWSAAWVATMGTRLPSVIYPNAYNGADPNWAIFTTFDASGIVAGGQGPETVMSSRSHSTYHSLQTSAQKTSARFGLGFQASYTFSKSIDDTSATLGGYLGSSGTLLQASPQNPWAPGAEKGPSTFDTTHVFTLSLIEALPFDRINALRPLGRKLTGGWQFLNVTTLTSGAPFTVFSGIQQTGAGSNGADRPDQVGRPQLSTGRTIREDYFGRGANNASFFYIPIGLPDGSGPTQGRFGTLGRSTFRGPAFHDLDMSLIKDTTFGRRGNAEAATLEFRAEFFNIFNLVNFSLPSNVVLGSGFGLINKTVGPSRQIQFSLKLMF